MDETHRENAAAAAFIAAHRFIRSVVSALVSTNGLISLPCSAALPVYDGSVYMHACLGPGAGSSLFRTRRTHGGEQGKSRQDLPIHLRTFGS